MLVISSNCHLINPQPHPPILCNPLAWMYSGFRRFWWASNSEAHEIIFWRNTVPEEENIIKKVHTHAWKNNSFDKALKALLHDPLWHTIIRWILTEEEELWISTNFIIIFKLVISVCPEQRARILYILNLTNELLRQRQAPNLGMDLLLTFRVLDGATSKENLSILCALTSDLTSVLDSTWTQRIVVINELRNSTGFDWYDLGSKLCR